MSGWCIPYKNSDRKKGKGKGLASDFIQIFISIAELNNKSKITLECYGDDLKDLYEKKGFHVTTSENINANSQNSNSEMVTKYNMEYLLPDMPPGAPRPLLKHRVRYRTRSANSMKKPTRYGRTKRHLPPSESRNRIRSTTRVSRRRSI